LDNIGFLKHGKPRKTAAKLEQTLLSRVIVQPHMGWQNLDP
jgi:hypothetical protein